MIPHDRPFRVFVDASVLFSAALSSSGSARDLIRLGTSDHVELFMSTFVVLEVERNLELKARRALPAFNQFLQSEIIKLTEPTSESVRDIAAVVEPKDAPIVAGAMAISAPFIASYDQKHLLSHAHLIEQRFQIRVATPAELLALISL